MSWFPKNTPATIAAQNAAAQQTALDEIAQSTDAAEQILSNPVVSPIGGATEATQQLNQQALGTEGGGVTVPPPGGATGILGWIRSIREFFQSTMTMVGLKPAIDVNVVQTVGGGAGGGDASAANQVIQTAALNAILTKIIAAPSTEAKQDAAIVVLGNILTALGATITVSLPAGASTEAKQDAIIVLLNALGVLLAGTLTVSAAALPLPAGASTEATLAAVLAKLIAAPASEAKQDALIALMPAALSALGNFKVAVQEALPAGSAIIGKVGIDQTTPGTTNAVEVIKDVKSSTSNVVAAVLVAGGDILVSNSSRKSWGIQNLGTDPIFVYMKTGASSTVFHFCLSGGIANDDGKGAAVQDDIYTGVVSVSGTSPRFTVFEL